MSHHFPTGKRKRFHSQSAEGASAGSHPGFPSEKKRVYVHSQFELCKFAHNQTWRDVSCFLFETTSWLRAGFQECITRPGRVSQLPTPAIDGSRNESILRHCVAIYSHGCPFQRKKPISPPPDSKNYLKLSH